MDFKLAPKGEANQLGIDKVEKLLVNSVEKSLDADVPVGVFGGGVDSSLQTSIVVNLIKILKPIRFGYAKEDQRV